MLAVRMARSAKLGDLRLFNSVFSMQVRVDNIRTDSAMGGGPLFDIGIYCINAARYMFRAEPTEVMAAAARGDDKRFKEIDEAVSVLLRFPGERLATLVCSFGAADTGYFQVVGTRGDLVLDPAFEYEGRLAHELTIGDRTRRREFRRSD